MNVKLEGTPTREPENIDDLDPRSRIARIAQRLRQAKTEDEPDQVQENVESHDDEDLTLFDPEPAEIAKPAVERATEERDSDPILVLKVDGKEVRLRQSEVIAKAQMNFAAENRLEKAKTILQEIKTKQDPEIKPETVEAINKPVEKPKPDREKLRAIAETLITGDENEATDALLELHEMTSAHANVQTHNVPDIKSVVDSSLKQRDMENQISQAVNRFKSENPDLHDDEDNRELVLKTAIREMKNDIISLGLSEEQLQDALKNPQTGIVTQQAIAAAHNKLMSSGEKVRSYDQILADSAQLVRKKYNISAPEQNTKNSNADASLKRIEQKRSQQSQPKPASSQRSQTPTQPKRKTAVDIIKERRKAMGYPVAD